MGQEKSQTKNRMKKTRKKNRQSYSYRIFACVYLNF